MKENIVQNNSVKKQQYIAYGTLLLAQNGILAKMWVQKCEYSIETKWKQKKLKVSHIIFKICQYGKMTSTLRA